MNNRYWLEKTIVFFSQRKSKQKKYITNKEIQLLFEIQYFNIFLIIVKSDNMMTRKNDRFS